MGDTKVWMLQEWNEGGDYHGFWETRDPEEGIWSTEEAARKVADVINAERKAKWLARNDGFTESSWDYGKRMDRWKTENFDVPESERTPRPERRQKNPDDFPDYLGVLVIGYEVRD